MTQYETICLFTSESLPYLQISNTSPGALKAAPVDTVRAHMHTAQSPKTEKMEPGCLGLQPSYASY